MSTVSRHLALMQSVGLIAAEKRSAWVWYRLCVPCVLNFMGCIQAVIERNASEHAALVPAAGARPRTAPRRSRSR